MTASTTTMTLYDTTCAIPGVVMYWPSTSSCATTTNQQCKQMTSGATSYNCFPPITNYAAKGVQMLKTYNFIQVNEFSPSDPLCNGTRIATHQYTLGNCFTFTNLDAYPLVRFRSAVVAKSSNKKNVGVYEMKLFKDKICKDEAAGNPQILGTVGKCRGSDVTGTFVVLVK
ncbi:UNVERIFIED_CONTAM: hypothetical protein HDU68_001253 [Siphonaria sp. JEL0065]|nr:hypothetical protein HDU68_001253 [Siphonaria sp. JEL0065]